MAFKSVNEVKAEKYSGKFILENDGDTAFVIFLYRSSNDMLAAQAHYIKSNDYSGYVHCNEGGCAACAKGIRVQTKLFVPMLVMAINGQPVNEIQFWDRNMTFEPVLSQAIFKSFADPSAYVFQITRHGAHGSKDTTYSITVADTNKIPFDQIMSDYQISFPTVYEKVIREVDNVTLSQWLATANAANVATNSAVPQYVATPRVSAAQVTGLPNVLTEVEDKFADDEDISEDVDFGD